MPGSQLGEAVPNRWRAGYAFVPKERSVKKEGMFKTKPAKQNPRVYL